MGAFLPMTRLCCSHVQKNFRTCPLDGTFSSLDGDLPMTPLCGNNCVQDARVDMLLR